MRLQIEGIYFFIDSITSLIHSVNVYPEFSERLILPLLENKTSFLNLGEDSNDLKYLIETYPHYTDRFILYLLNIELLNKPTSSYNLGELIARNELINDCVKLFPNYVESLLEKKACEQVIFKKKPHDLKEFFLLIKSFTSHKEICIEKVLNENFDTIFSHYSFIQKFINKFPQYKEHMRKKLFNEDLSKVKKFLQKGNLFNLLSDFIEEKEIVFSLFIDDNDTFLYSMRDFRCLQSILSKFSAHKEEILEKAFSNPLNFQLLMKDDISLIIFCEEIGDDLLPYLEPLIKKPLLCRRYLTSAHILEKIHKTLPKLFSDLIPIVLNDERIFKRVFSKPWELYLFLDKIEFSENQIKCFITNIFKWHDPLVLFKNEGGVFARLASFAPKKFKKILKDILSKDDEFFTIFKDWSQIKECTKVFPEYKDMLIRKFIKDEKKFKTLMNFKEYSSHNYQMIQVAEAFPEYPLFRLKNSEEKIKQSHERLEEWAKISLYLRNSFSKSLSIQSIHLIGMFAADGDVHNSVTASEVIGEALQAQL